MLRIIPEFKPKHDELAKGWLGDYFCPCHGSKYKFLAVYEGVRPVPPYRFVPDKVIRVGENSKGCKFDGINQAALSDVIGRMLP
jgi:ubiquinol-cytochrome c reductase iron-sulfur subunit